MIDLTASDATKLRDILQFMSKDLKNRAAITELSDKASVGDRAAYDRLRLASVIGSNRLYAEAETRRIESLWISLSVMGDFRISDQFKKSESAMTACELLTALRHSDWRVRARASIILGRDQSHWGPELLPALILAIKDESHLEALKWHSITLAKLLGLQDTPVFLNADYAFGLVSSNGEAIKSRLLHHQSCPDIK